MECGSKDLNMTNKQPSFIDGIYYLLLLFFMKQPSFIDGIYYILLLFFMNHDCPYVCMCLYRTIILLLLFIPSLFFCGYGTIDFTYTLLHHPLKSQPLSLPLDDVSPHPLKHHPLETHYDLEPNEKVFSIRPLSIHPSWCLVCFGMFLGPLF
jgi:hypothetical protein